MRRYKKTYWPRRNPPAQAFEYAIRREKGLKNQLQIRKQGSSTFSSKQTGRKSEPVGFIQNEEGTHIAIIDGGTEVEDNHSGELHNDKAATENNLVLSAEIRSDPEIFNNARQKIKSAINARKEDTTPDSVILQTSMQSVKNKIPN